MVDLNKTPINWEKESYIYNRNPYKDHNSIVPSMNSNKTQIVDINSEFEIVGTTLPLHHTTHTQVGGTAECAVLCKIDHICAVITLPVILS